MSQISTDSYSYAGLNDLASVHSSNSYSAGPSDEFHYDGSDMLYAWELSSRFNHHISRGARLEDLHLISASVLPASYSGKGILPPPAPLSNAADNYLLENPFDHSTIHFDNNDYPIKISLAANVPSSSSAPYAQRSNNRNNNNKASSELTITDDLLEQFQNLGRSKDINKDVASSSKTETCPERPYHLMKTHINLKLTDPNNADAATNNQQKSQQGGPSIEPVESIVGMVMGCLQTFPEYDFSFFPKLYLWKGKYLQGSSSCLINIHLYKEKFEDSAFIIEANRISGEAKPFHEFFKAFKKLLCSNLPNSNSTSSGLNSLGCGCNSNSASSSFDEAEGESGGFSSPFYSSSFLDEMNANYNGGLQALSVSTSPLKKLSCCDFQKSIEPILNMTKCLFYEVKLEAAKMLCDVANSCENEVYLRDAKCLDQIFKAIENLIAHNDGFLAVKEQAIVAFGSFIDKNQNKEVLQRMMKSQVLHTLLQLINNPTNESTAYETAQMRREAARVLSILASFDASGLLQSLEMQQISGYALKKWYDNVDFLRDQRTRLYALRIRELLSNAQLLQQAGGGPSGGK